MTRIEYDLLREEWPEATLPQWEQLTEWIQFKVTSITREELLARRMAVLLRKDDSGSVVYNFDPMLVEHEPD